MMMTVTTIFGDTFVFDSDSHIKFHRMWELVRIRYILDAICETIGSIMGQHCAKSSYLKPENFNKEIVLRVNLEPLHLLDNFIK